MASVDLQEKANFTRLSRLLVDKGTEALRTTFDSIHPPANLSTVLNAHGIYHSLLKLKPRVINFTQWDLLYPTPGNPPADSKSFDVTLLTVLLRNICGLPAPATGWDVMPPDTDRSVSANIARIKLLRNDVYAHVTSTQVDNATYESLWQKIGQALVDLKIAHNDIDHLKTSPLGPEEETYVENLKEWKMKDDECSEVLKSIELSMNRLTTLTEESRDEVKQLQQSALQQQNDDAKSMKCSMDRLTTLTEESRDEIKQLHQSALQQQNDEVKSMKCSMDRLTTLSEESRDEIKRLHQSALPQQNDQAKEINKNDVDILRKLAKHNFKSKIQRKVKLFCPGTREWLLKKLDDWFTENEQKSRLLLLTAGPGFGKSVFAAKVCEDFKKERKLAACHFCDFSDSNLRNPMTMLQSLASQMCENVAGFKEKLLDQLRRPHQVETLKDAFGIYLRNPLDELALEEPILVLIDGLDESAADNKNEIVDLIASYFPDLPQCVKVLVTSRPEISVAKLSHLQKINVGTDDSKNDLDLEHYLKACLPRPAEKKEEIYQHITFKKFVRKCEGSFLYAFYLQSELQKRDDLSNMTYSEIDVLVPRGLNSIYQNYFKRLEDELNEITHENIDVLTILRMLVASDGSVPLTFVTRALGLTPDCRDTWKIIAKVNEAVSCLLYVSDDQVTVFHKTVIDWLLANGYEDHEYVVKKVDGCQLLWPMCEKSFREIKETVCLGHDMNPTVEMKYALRHGHRFLISCNMQESFFWLVDVVIIQILLDEWRRSFHLMGIWQNLLEGCVVISDELRKRISWHVVEIAYLRKTLPGDVKIPYLESVLTNSPKGYFSDDERAIAKLFLSKFPPFVELKIRESEIMPLAVMAHGKQRDMTIFGISLNTMIAAVAGVRGTISVMRLPNLVELWQYSTEYERVSCCTFAPDGSFILFGRLRTVLDIAERREVPFFRENEETFTCCAFSPNGKRLVTSDRSRIVKLWDVAKQSLLTSLDAAAHAHWCSFSSTGLFIIAGKKRDEADSLCAWNAITWQRSDQRNLPEEILEKPGVLRSKTCDHCLQPGFVKLSSSKRLKFLAKRCAKSNMSWSTGNYKGVECIFVVDKHSLKVIEMTHFTTLAVWNLQGRMNDVRVHDETFIHKISAREDNLWFYADEMKLIVFRTTKPTHEQSSCLPRPTCVVSSSFSPDGSRLATCTSDGYINIWNVNTNQVVQRFKSSHGQSSFRCWWSQNFLFVFDVIERIPRLSKYPVNDSLEILFTQVQQVSLRRVVDEFADLPATIDFSEGILSLECGKTKPTKVLDVNEAGEPRMIFLPEIRPGMRIKVSQGAAFIFGGNKEIGFIWKKVPDKPAVYEILQNHFKLTGCFSSSFSFSHESKHAVVQYEELRKFADSYYIIDLAKCSRTQQVLNVPSFASTHYFFDSPTIFCIDKKRIVIISNDLTLVFLDMDSGAIVYYSVERNLTKEFLELTKLSPKGTVIAFPKTNGDMEFVRLCIPRAPELARIKKHAEARRRANRRPVHSSDS